MRPFLIRTLLLAPLVLLVACSSGQDAPDADGRHKIGLQLNWVPEPEFGGYYAARDLGAFQDAGLAVEIRPGGPGIPGLQMVAAGQVEFGITSADSILVARERGANVVAVFALYQTFPEGIMVHAERGLKSIGDVFEGGTLAMEPGTPYHRMLERRYGLAKIRAVPYSNNLGPFLHDPHFAQQCFITAEPIAARRAGANPQVFPISAIGYNPYSGVIFTRRQFLNEHPERVAALVRAVRQGWAAYLNDPAPANRTMHALNPTMDLDTFTEAAAIQKPLILGDDQPPQPLGSMTLERWQALAEQLRDLGLISRVEPAAAFVNP
jgi:NitT/TauT family transport system substrate-binding protein